MNSRIYIAAALTATAILASTHHSYGAGTGLTDIQATSKKVAAYEAAKLASDFDPQNRDENVDYYVTKLDELVKKFGGVSAQASAPEQESLAL